MSHDITIRKVTADDITRLQDISRKTFATTFASQNTEADIQKYLEENLSLQRLTAEFINPDSEFYFAISDADVIGYLKLNFGAAQTELKDNNALEIERIYVLKEYHGKKIGQLLYNKAIEVARDKKASYLWLGVWENNERAISFYKKNGFTAFDKHIFTLGDDEQTDIMMRLFL